MNQKYKNCPEVIGDVKLLPKNGDDKPIGCHVIGIQVLHDDSLNSNGTVQLDVRGFRGGNLVVEIELPELMAAISMATLNAEKS